MTSEHDSFEPFHQDPIRRAELAIEDIRAGRMVILVDDEDRENEGDLVVAAEKCTPEVINFMATHARGLICLSMTGEQVERLGIPMMSTNNQSAYNTAFTVSIEARHGVTTGISAADRAHTVQVAIRDDATPRDIVAPGHMFPLRARDGGVLERVGQTEGSVDLARMAGLGPAGVICEIMRDDGTMARLDDLKAFGVHHRVRICAVADLIKYRLRTERIVAGAGDGALAIDGLGSWRTRLYRGMRGELHMALWQGDLTPASTLVRVQAAPASWSFLDPGVSRISQQARAALRQVHAEGHGVVVLMHLSGAGENAVVHAYHRDLGGDEAPHTRPQEAALRDLGAGCQILVDLGLRDLRLLVGSDRPIRGIDAYGLSLGARIPLDVA